MVNALHAALSLSISHAHETPSPKQRKLTVHAEPYPISKVVSVTPIVGCWKVRKVAPLIRNEES